MNILLETSRIRLRAFTEKDIDHLYALDNDPAVMRFINGGAPISRAVVVDQILPVFMRYSPGSCLGVWAADDKENGSFWGWFSLRPSAKREEAILGYRLRRVAWGRGLATEGARALVTEGFMKEKLQRVIATTYEENQPSRRVMEKLGMKLVRRFRLSADDLAGMDTFVADSVEIWDGDDLEYAVDRGTWVRRHGDSLMLVKGE